MKHLYLAVSLHIPPPPYKKNNDDLKNQLLNTMSESFLTSNFSTKDK